MKVRCIYNKSQDEQINGRRMSDTESMGMLFDDPPDISVDAFIKWCADCHMMGDATIQRNVVTLMEQTKGKQQ